jgi:hypothetical protein
MSGGGNMAKVEEFRDPEGQIVPLNNVGESVVRGFVVKPGEVNKELDDFLNKDTIMVQLLEKRLDENNNMVLYFLGIKKAVTESPQPVKSVAVEEPVAKPVSPEVPSKRGRRKKKQPQDSSPEVSFELI